MFGRWFGGCSLVYLLLAGIGFVLRLFVFGCLLYWIAVLWLIVGYLSYCLILVV